MSNSAISAAIAIPCISPNPLVAKCVSECQAKCPEAEIYVVADSAQYDAYDASVVLIETGPITMAAKRNLVARRTLKAYIALIDSDAYPDHQWLQNAIAVLEGEPEVWIVGGPNISPLIQTASERCVGCAQRSYLLTGAYAFRKKRSAARYVDDLPSCNMVLRRRDYLSLGGMREDLYTYEDKELCAKVITSGKKIYFTPEVTVFHKDRSVGMLAVQRLIWGAALWKGLRSSQTRLYLLMPTIAVCFFLTLPAALLIPYWGYLYAIILALYLCLVGIEVIRGAERLTDAPGVFAAIVIGNLGPGVGSIGGPLGLLPDLRKFYRNYSDE